MPPLKKSKKTSVQTLQLPDRDTLLKILDHMYDELFVIDRNGMIIYVNRACERHYGVQQHEMIGKTVTECTEKGFWYPPISPIALRNPKIATYEQATNTGRKLVATVAPVFDDKGNLEMVVENLRDITKLEQVKNDLKATKRLLTRYRREVQQLRNEELHQDFLANSEPMKKILRLAKQVAQVDSSILILGETGTGKSLIAKFIHRVSHRKDGPFITVNCASIPEQLLESELFGYSPGAFTGADPKGKMGLLELADGGTLFLDEISDIPIHLQVKLLQVLQEREYRPVGGTKHHSADFRVIAATNQDISELVQQGEFRKDLFYRINTIEIEVPPLRKRKEDLSQLAQYFINKYDKLYKMEHHLTPEAQTILSQYHWPGNVREMEHLIERLVITAPNQSILPEHLPPYLTEESPADLDEASSLDDALQRAEKYMISNAYMMLKSSYKVAENLKITQSRAYRLIKKYGLITDQLS